MPQIPRETTEQVLAATRIVDVIGSYLQIKRAGTRYVALCPFHNEKSPSFSINPVGEFFHCFGCGKSGDAITFVREYENLTFADAVKKLAARAGIVVREEEVDPNEDRARRQRGRLLDLHREVARFLHEQLLKSLDAKHARDYLNSRGFGKEMAVRWTIGWMPENPRIFLDWAREKKLSGRDLIDSGLLGRGERGDVFVRFRDRLMFPIRNDPGDVIAFSGRQLREDPRSGKYINSPETPLFKKSNVLFALDRARKAMLTASTVLICEGQIDAICCHEQGIENAIAPLGTAFTPGHAQLLRRYAKNAVLCYDADKAGFTATERAFRELAAQGLNVRVIRMPAGEDPDSFMRKNGADAFRALLAGAVDFFDSLLDRAQSDGKLDLPENRALFARECAPLLSLVADPVSRDAMINHVATRLRAAPPELRSAVARAGRANSQRKAHRPGEEAAAPAVEVIEPAPLDPVVAYLCSLALHSGAAQEWLGEQFETLHEAAEHLEGVPLLESILSARPDAASPASVNTFLAGLEEPQRRALYADPTFHAATPEDPRTAAEEAMARLSAKCLLRRDSQVKAQLSQATGPEMIRLLEEAKEIQALIGGLDQRFLFDDRLIPTSRRPAKPQGRDFRESNRERNP